VTRALRKAGIALVALLAALAAVPPAGAQGAPSVALSGDGRTATAGPMRLSVSQAHDLTPGQPITVSGSGYDVNKGVYVALCMVPPTGMPPSPCAGGQDRSGTGGYSEWISSNPPREGQGLTIPYGPGGSFTITLTAAPNLPNGLDCYQVRCAIYTRYDHVRTSDRGADVGVPVTFAAAPAPTDPPPPPEPTTAPPTTEATTTTEAATTTEAPTTTEATTTTTEAETEQDEEISGAPIRSEDDGGGSAAPIVLGIVVVLLLGGAVAGWQLRRRAAGPGAGEA